MTDDLPPHIDAELYQKGKDEFEKSEYDGLREYVRAIQDSPMDTSDTIMNIHGDFPTVEGVEPPHLGPYSISEYINEQANIDVLESADLAHLEDAFTSWEAGALAALKYDE